ncbi:YncE family protein [Rubellicoccus peritrichatus]|uniref:YncE family protein n=1 Tax=Rubellicoccus peritrichatus TaxID=3080537 RepID=A0AAQ3QTA5_9BACT|nr:YncE family protein [Puniceicoccus sp. CR14]WOO41116.1 YncE family protein [Puniceicoccus sp. CR14]
MKLTSAIFVSVIVSPLLFGNTLMVGNKYASTVSFIDLNTAREVVQPETGGSPHELTLSPDKTELVVVSYMEDGYIGQELNVFDVASTKLIKTISISPHKAPHGIEWIGDTDDVIVTTEETHDVIKVNIPEGKVVASVATDQIGTHLLALSPDAKTAYVTNRGSGTFCVIDVPNMQLLKTVKAGKGPEGVTVSPDSKELWIGNNQSENIFIYDTDTLKQIDTIDVQFLPIRVRFSPDGKVVAVADLHGNRIVIYDAATRKEIAAIDVASEGAIAPASLLFAPDGTYLYAGAQDGARVVEIDCKTWKVVRIFKAGAGSDGLAISPVSMKPIQW